MSEATARPLEDHDPCTDMIVAGERLTCDWSGCLFWPDEETLIVSDLHLEKGSSFASRGSLVPPYDTGATLNRLAQRLAVWQPKRVISLGDSFHDPKAHERLPENYLNTLTGLMTEREWIWISGNHDPLPPQELGGTGAREMLIGNLVFRHEPQSGNQLGEIAGHLHPCGKIIRRNRSVRRPCFVSDGNRMIMPSFGAYTGGLNIRHSAFDHLFDETSLSAVLLGKKTRISHSSQKSGCLNMSIASNFTKPKMLKAGALIMVLSIILANAYLGNSGKSSADYVLAISWQPGFCETASRKPECKTQTADRYDASHFSLHGLWPQPGSNIYCNVSDDEIAMDKSGRWRDLDAGWIDESIWRDLQRIMPGTRSALHKHEWVKHGTCTGSDINEYYAQSIWLIEALNDSALRNLFANNLGKSLTADEIRLALDKSFGEGAGSRLRVSCKRDNDSGRQLIVELTLGLANPFGKNAGLSELVLAAPETDPGCPSGIVDPAGFQ